MSQRFIPRYTWPMAKTPSKQPMSRCLIDNACVWNNVCFSSYSFHSTCEQTLTLWIVNAYAGTTHSCACALRSPAASSRSRENFLRVAMARVSSQRFYSMHERARRVASLSRETQNGESTERTLTSNDAARCRTTPRSAKQSS